MQYAADSLKSDRDFVKKAVVADGKALGYLHSSFLDRDLVLTAVRSDPGAFEMAEQFQGDREIALEAVRADGNTLEFASTELQADKEIVGTAVMGSSRAI